MPCACSSKKQSKAVQAVTKVRVTCPGCAENLIGVDGSQYPAHLTPVIVSSQQVEIWRAAGHVIEILN